MILKAPPRPFTMPMLARKPKPRQTREEWIDEIFSVYSSWYAQPKIDGIRCVHYHNDMLSRTMKPIPNDHIRTTLLNCGLPLGTDGEIITLDETTLQPKKFHDIQSDVMTKNGKPLFRYVVFDYAIPSHLEESFRLRYHDYWPFKFLRTHDKYIRDFTAQTHIVTRENFAQVEQAFIEQNYEGVILRQPMSQYWCGPNRPTLKQGSLVAVTAWQTAEAVVVSLQEQMTNNNSVGRDAGGRVKRSKSLCNLTGAAMVGALVVEDIKTGKIFNIGTGFTDAQKLEWWKHPASIKDAIITYKYKPYGEKDLPRSPVFLGIRRDLV